MRSSKGTRPSHELGAGIPRGVALTNLHTKMAIKGNRSKKKKSMKKL